MGTLETLLGNCARMLWRCIKINTQTHTVQLYIFGPESQFDAVSSSPPLPMEFLRQKYWSGLPVPSPRDSPAPGSVLIYFFYQLLKEEC